MEKGESLKFLFIINSGSGNGSTDWVMIILDYFKFSNHIIKLYEMPKESNLELIKNEIKIFSPKIVVAVGGDGTVNSVATCLLETNIIMGILPAGSANGLAKELGLMCEHKKALDVIVKRFTKKIHVLKINNHMCIHLSDVGLNAFAMKEFKNNHHRGMLGYIRVLLKVILKNPKIVVRMHFNENVIKIKASQIVIANATKYGSGAVINPIGNLADKLFEVVAVKKLSFIEIFKMIFSHASFNPKKTEIFQMSSLSIHSAQKIHFQIDGEYLGMVNDINATLIPSAINMIVPEN